MSRGTSPQGVLAAVKIALSAFDVSAFYLSIHRKRVYKLLTGLGCSPDVARLITQLCTYDYHLALGLLTSPILANEIFAAIDRRLARLAEDRGLIYSRFVDDLIFSGNFDFSASSVPKLVEGIVDACGFTIQTKKHRMGTAPTVPITQLVVRRGKVDVQETYVEELVALMEALRQLGNGGPFTRYYATRAQIVGSVYAVGSTVANSGFDGSVPLAGLGGN